MINEYFCRYDNEKTVITDRILCRSEDEARQYLFYLYGKPKQDWFVQLKKRGVVSHNISSGCCES